jgi:hypothetical protein
MSTTRRIFDIVLPIAVAGHVYFLRDLNINAPLPMTAEEETKRSRVRLGRHHLAPGGRGVIEWVESPPSIIRSAKHQCTVLQASGERSSSLPIIVRRFREKSKKNCENILPVLLLCC